jgi:hypothetical protein
MENREENNENKYQAIGGPLTDAWMAENVSQNN